MAHDQLELRLGHNGGPPLDETPHVPEWGQGPIGGYFYWKSARRAALHAVSHDIARRRFAAAERVGLTYEEYVLEIVDSGRYLHLPEDARRIDAIKRARAHRK